jgi:hypothetical protein
VADRGLERSRDDQSRITLDGDGRLREGMAEPPEAVKEALGFHLVVGFRRREGRGLPTEQTAGGRPDAPGASTAVDENARAAIEGGEKERRDSRRPRTRGRAAAGSDRSAQWGDETNGPAGVRVGNCWDPPAQNRGRGLGSDPELGVSAEGPVPRGHWAANDARAGADGRDGRHKGRGVTVIAG